MVVHVFNLILLCFHQGSECVRMRAVTKQMMQERLHQMSKLNKCSSSPPLAEENNLMASVKNTYIHKKIT